MQAGQILLVLPGHSCVLKVHTSISYGTKSSDELIQRNFSLAVEVRAAQDSPAVLQRGEYVHGAPLGLGTKHLITCHNLLVPAQNEGNGMKSLMFN